MKHEEVVQMSFFSKLNDKFKTVVKKYKRATPKQLVLVGVFMLALAGTIGAGFASQTGGSAATYYTPDCDSNAIMKCGAPDRVAFCNNYATNNGGKHNDLAGVYGDSKIGLSVSDCKEHFAKEAVEGLIFRDGHVEVKGQTVAYDVKTIGRSGYAGSPISLSGKTYYHGTPQQRWSNGVDVMPVMVWFDADGKAKVIIMNNCGNPVIFKPKTPSVTCEGLNEKKVSKNKYTFTAKEPKVTNNQLIKKISYEYWVDGKYWTTTTSANEVTKVLDLNSYKKDVTVEVKIKVTFLDGKTKTVTHVLCKKEIKFEREEKKVKFVCETLKMFTADNKTFRFTAVPKSENATAVSADFTIDGTTKVNVDKMTGEGFVLERTFNDNKVHNVKAVINFEYKDKDGKTVKGKSQEPCQKNTTVTPPVCEPKEDEDDNCNKLPVTGPAGVAGLFAGVSAFGAIGHRLFMNRRNRQ